MIDRPMPFGKHKGKPLSAVPSSYLRWLLAVCTNAGEDLRRAVRAELARRNDPGPARRSAYHGVRAQEPPACVTPEEVEARILQTLLDGERSGDFGRGPALDALWTFVATAFALLARRPAGGPRSVRELLDLARRLEKN